MSESETSEGGTGQLTQGDLKAMAARGEHAEIVRAHREGRLDDLLRSRVKEPSPE